MKLRAVFLLAIGFLFGRVAFGATQLITNGGFETVPPDPWIAAANLPSITLTTNSTAAHGGFNFLTLGNATGNPNSPIYLAVLQNLTIPTNALAVRFSYFWGCSVSSPDQNGADVFSPFVQVNDTPTYFDQRQSANSGFAPANFDFNNLAGQSLQFGFIVQPMQASAGIQTYFAVDDVSLLCFTADDIPGNDNFDNAILLTTTTNASSSVTNIVASKEAGEPKHAGNAGGHSVWWKWVAPANGVATINTTNSTFNTVLAVYTGSTVSNLTSVGSNDDNAGRGDGTSQVKVNVTTGTEYEIAIDGKAGASGVAQLNLSFSVDEKDPTIKITSPKKGSKVTDSTVTVQGTATDNLGISLVQYRLENAAGTNDYQNADGTNSWTATVNNLVPGPNTIRVRAFDTSNNQSTEATTTVSFTVVSTLTVNVLPAGSGTVTPNLNQTEQPVGNSITLTAKPVAGQVFSSWSGDVSANTASITFVMQSNMVVNANFAPNPFTPVVGTYQGLIYDTNGLTHHSSGFFTATLTSAGSFSAKVTLAGGKAQSISGQFSAGGVFSNNVARKGSTPLTVQLNLDLAGNGMTGVFSDGTFISELIASKTVTSAGDVAGKYTLLIPGGTNGVAQPGGDSYGTITVSSSGAISLKGVLADGSKVTQKANLLSTGQWAFYVPLYAGKGSILSWLTFSNGVIDGNVEWFKPSGSGGKLYTGGFTNTTEAVGSSYVFTSGVPVLDFTDGQIWLANGNLADGITNGITLSTASKVTSTNSAVKVTITTSTGLFKGSVPNPAGGKPIAVNGVVLQKQNSGGGFFTGTTQTGRVFIGP